VSVCVLAHLLAAAPASALAIIDTAFYGGHTYYLLEPSTWLEAEAAAIGLGGHLVTIDDAAENAFVSGRFGYVPGPPATGRDLWIGLTDRDNEDHFTWASGAPLVYTNWAPSEPNNCTFVGCLSEDYVIMYQAYSLTLVGTWNDFTNDQVPLSGVVEVVPEPSTLALLGLGAATLAARRRRS
jgi:hypothetical protein